MLDATESVSDFKEVTEAEMRAIKEKDEAFVAPSEELTAEYESTCTLLKCNGELIAKVGRLNRTTGYFEFGNFVKDATEEDVRTMLDFGKVYSHDAVYAFTGYSGRIAILRQRGWEAASNQAAFCFCGKVESVAVYGYYGELRTDNASEIFRFCSNLKEVVGILDISKCTTAASTHMMFIECKKLREVRLFGLSSNLTLEYCPDISLESIRYLCENAKDDTDKVLRLHPDVYAKVNDESNAEWHPIAAIAIEKRITLTTTA